MLKQALLCAVMLVLAATRSVSGPPEPVARDLMRSPSQIVRLPGTAIDIAVGVAAVEPGSTAVNAELLTAIVDWLSSNYDLPPLYDPPAIEFVSAEMMAALRHRDIPSDLWSSRQAANIGYLDAARSSSTIVALYDDADGTIYLPKTWVGNTPVELSVLVHEMVHHLQNLAGMTFACLEAREELAYAAQQEWLALFGRDMFTEFETDAFTLLVRTQCAY